MTASLEIFTDLHSGLHFCYISKLWSLLTFPFLLRAVYFDLLSSHTFIIVFSLLRFLIETDSLVISIIEITFIVLWIQNLTFIRSAL